MLELGGIVILGIIAQWLAWRLKVPAILPLIIIGLLVGPFSTLWSASGNKWISPMWDGHHGLFPGDSLFHFVELAIGIILFEGGMTLKRNEIRGVGDTIGKLISLGALITFIISALLAHYIVNLNWAISFLFASLIIVTGPTVIAPILRNVPLSRNVATVLKWEGILIDPIGALAAVLVYEFISSTGHEGSFTSAAFVQFLQILFVSLSLGTMASLAFRELLKRDWIPHYLLTIFTLAFVLALFIGSGYIVPDSGLLTVVVGGMVLGNIDVPHIKEISYFKESLSILLISILFILLAANINLEDLQLLQDWRPILLFSLVVLMVRPIAVFASTAQSMLNTNEKVFISWMGPRGIVAAGIASLFGLKLSSNNFPDAEWITPMVFMVVLGTVLLNATTARVVARMLGVALKSSDGILIFGATRACRLIAKYLHDSGVHVILLDTNKANIGRAEKMGLRAIEGDIYGDELLDNLELNDVGYMMAMTGSNDVNAYAINTFDTIFGENGAFRLITPEESEQPDSIDEYGLFSKNCDFYAFNEIARDYPNIYEMPIDSAAEYEEVMRELEERGKTIPLFLKTEDNSITIIPANYESAAPREPVKLVYLGRRYERETSVEAVSRDTNGS